jgi:hypothetical protein
MTAWRLVLPPVGLRRCGSEIRQLIQPLSVAPKGTQMRNRPRSRRSRWAAVSGARPQCNHSCHSAAPRGGRRHPSRNGAITDPAHGLHGGAGGSTPRISAPASVRGRRHGATVSTGFEHLRLHHECRPAAGRTTSRTCRPAGQQPGFCGANRPRCEGPARVRRLPYLACSSADLTNSIRAVPDRGRRLRHGPSGGSLTWPRRPGVLMPNGAGRCMRRRPTPR